MRSRGGCVLHLHPSRAQQDEHLWARKRILDFTFKAFGLNPKR